MLFRRPIITFLNHTRKCYRVVKGKGVKEEHVVTRQINSKIKSCGPITVADFMREVLINPTGGYYMHKDVFGEGGDFITSPELGQMFGEMVAVWFLNEWSKLGCPKPIQIVELGPGRGTLCEDILRVFEHFRALEQASVHLVEVSPHLSTLQSQRLCMQSEHTMDEHSVTYRQGISRQGIPVKWYRNFDDIPNGFTLLIAHEFFDALPIHKFQRTNNGYREVLIDIDPAKEMSFRYVSAKDATPMQKLLVKPSEQRDHFEASMESLLLVERIAKRLFEHGGIALIADYGEDGTATDTFRAYKQHKQQDPLLEPGTADLTADVDFAALREAATKERNIICYGPVKQRDFLLNVGIEHRYKMLCEMMNEKDLEGIKYGYKMMMDEDQMGKRFKFLSLFPGVIKDILDKYPPVGFK